MTGPGTILPPTSIARRLVRYILGFGVGVAVGLAPFLGRAKVPGFSAMLELYPLQMQQNLIILSGFLLGIVAVAVQFYAAKRSATDLLERYFGLLLKTMLVVLLLLVILYYTSVESVLIDRRVQADPKQVETHRYALVLGWFRGDAEHCPCSPGSGTLQCVKELSLDPDRIGTCWKYLKLFELALTLPYLFLLGGFGTLVGLLLLREEEQRHGKPSPAPKPRPARKPSAAPKPSPPRKPRPAAATAKPKPRPPAKAKP